MKNEFWIKSLPFDSFLSVGRAYLHTEAFFFILNLTFQVKNNRLNICLTAAYTHSRRIVRALLAAF